MNEFCTHLGITFYSPEQPDSNGNRGIVLSFLNFLTENERRSDFSINHKYTIAFFRAKSIGFKKYRGKDFGGGFVCQYDFAQCRNIAKRIMQVRMQPYFLKEWSDKQHTKVKRAIARWFDKPFCVVDAQFGLAYTSSGAYAGEWVCSREEYYWDSKQYKYVGFAMDVNEVVYAILWDNNENEIFIKL